MAAYALCMAEFGKWSLTKQHLLGKFDLGRIPPAPRGQPQIEATDKGKKITIANDKGRLSGEQIEKMIKEAK